MNSDQRKKLQEDYRNRRPTMGVVALCCAQTGEQFFGLARNVQAEYNSLQAKLNGGMHPNKRLQELWNTHGESGFEYSTVQTIDYSNPAEITRDDLDALRDLCLAEHPTATKIWK